jgi:prophage maintenance system killer protein
VGILFLEMNSHAFTASATSAADTILAVASGDLDEVGLRAFLKENSQ